MSPDLFAHDHRPLPLGDGACLLPGIATADDVALIETLRSIADQAPFRHMQTPGGYTMSVAMTNCGEFGWVSDSGGYRYTGHDPTTSRSWPAMPTIFAEIARRAAAEAGYPEFEPDACLINRYQPGARLSPHQDRDERDLSHPIVSLSLGLPAVFLLGGTRRRDRMRGVPVAHGDIIVWGGALRLAYHGVRALAQGEHPLTGSIRFNLSFRCAG